MSTASPGQSLSTSLIVGASRGLGHAVAAEFLKRGWNVIGTVRGGTRTPLHELAEAHEGRLEIEILDINEPDQLAALRHRLSGRVLDALFVNAGTTTHNEPVHIGDVTTEEFMRVMVTNALSPMRVIEARGGRLDRDSVSGPIGGASARLGLYVRCFRAVAQGGRSPTGGAA